METLGYAFGAADLCAAGVGAPHIRQRLFFVAVSNLQRRQGISLQLRPRGSQQTSLEASGCSKIDLVGHSGSQGSGRNPGTVSCSEGSSEKKGSPTGDFPHKPELTGATRGFWANADWIPCRDRKARPVEPGSFPLVDGASCRMGRLRAYGNAIVPQVAATFIRASML
jgi:DNA (cytosine-5)-methyltransferase 1